MPAVLHALFLFLAWGVVGLAALVAIRADVSDLRIVLTAPALGTALTLLPLFALSNAGVPMKAVARPFEVVLFAASLGVLLWRRPSLSIAVIPVVGLCIVDLALVGRPMFHFGFDWIANANGDMAFYVLSATQLMSHGLQSPVDVHALTSNRELATWTQNVILAGLRPGSQISLAGNSATFGRSPVYLYMPMLLALNMCCISAAGSLAMQASRRWWAASVAAALLVVSPMAGYGVLQQLMPQVWGLGLSVALLSWLMRPEIHRNPGPRLTDFFVISVLSVALFVVYVELAASLCVAYALYVLLLVAQRRVSLRAVGLLWAVPLIAIVVVVNTFLTRELGYLNAAAHYGVSAGGAGVRLFGYALVPTALPGAAGLQRLSAGPTTPYMDVSILFAAVLLVGVFIVCLNGARKGAAAAIVLLGDFAIGIMLARNGNDFGLFKLYMYIQPFLAAAIGAWFSNLRHRVSTALVSILLVIVVGVQFTTLNAYVVRSTNPVDLPHASEADLLPKFYRFFSSTSRPVVSVTDNFVLGPLQGAKADSAPLYFLSRNFSHIPAAWKHLTFPIPSIDKRKRTVFSANIDASKILAQANCVLSFPSGSQITLNRRIFPEGSSDLIIRPCRHGKNLLVFIYSTLGQPATIPANLRAVSFWQLEADSSFPGRTFAGFGRYALLQIIGATPTVRVALSFTTSSTPARNGSYRLPSASVVGAARVRFPVVGTGSARVFSPPVRPRMIDGQAYVLLDMGRNGRFQAVLRPGLTGLWAKSVVLDPRALTSYVRDVSLMSPPEYSGLRAPRAIRHIPADLANPSLEYSGIFEDGWVGQRTYARLAGGPPSRLVIYGRVLPRPQGQALRVLVNGRVIDSRRVTPGMLDLRLRLPASRGPRTIDLRWAGVTQLPAPDDRQAAAHLTFLGLAGPVAVLRIPTDFADPGLVKSGIFNDGWAERDSYVVLAGGRAGTLVVRAQVPPRPQGQHLRVLVNGREMASRPVMPGELTLRVPTPASREARRVELHWTGEVPLRAPDTRRAAARLTFLGVVEPPPRIAHFPDDLKDPGLVYRGIFDDGWLAGQSQMVLAGGKPANLVLRAQVVSQGQRIEVRVNGRTVASKAVASGDVELRVPLPASTSPRTIELQFAGTTTLKAPDTRRAAARLTFIGLEAQPGAPSSVSIPADLAKPGLEATGVYADGWLEQSSVIVLRGGKAEDLVIRAEVPSPKGQRLQVLVNGKAVASQAVEPGGLDLRVPVPASRPNRRIELRFAGTIKLKAPDTRRAAALLQSIELKPRE